MQKGQVLAVVLLILGVVATVALSVASRSVTEVRVSTTQDESSRALEAAEIGLEKYLGNLSPPAPGDKVIVPDINAGYYIPSINTGGAERFYTVPYSLVEGDIATVDLPWCQDGACTMLRVCWGDGTPISEKVEVSFFYVMGDAANQGRVAVRRAGFDPAGTYPGFVTGSSRIHTNRTCSTDKTYNYETQIMLNDDALGVALGLGPWPANRLLFVRIRMLGNGQTAKGLAVELINKNIPTQGGEVVAIGEAGETIQKVRATVQQWDLPPMFDSALFSGTNLEK
jgi:type II secretory pathway pseudopilin PulG